jgi:hypothetical protein
MKSGRFLAKLLLVSTSLLSSQAPVPPPGLEAPTRKVDSDPRSTSALRKDYEAMKKIPGAGAHTKAMLVSLARRGETEALQELACEMFGPDRYRVASSSVSQVGGWFAIRVYLDLLSDPRRFDAIRPKGTRDVVIDSADVIALEQLRAVVPNLPAFAKDQIWDPVQRKRVEALWRQWVEEHKATLETLQPAGEGVIIEKQYCRQYLKKGKKRS